MVSLTEQAAKEVKRCIEEASMPEDTILRIGILAGGCSGFKYSIGLDNSVDDTKDFVSEQHGVKLAIDKKSGLHLDGTTIDFHESIDARGFTFENPNVTKSCGCGSSFSA